MTEPPCVCWEKGCEHLMSWHRFIADDRAVCEVPGCFCYTSTTCSEHIQRGADSAEDDASFLRAVGISGKESE